MDLALRRRVASRYCRYRALIEERRERPHVARSELYVANRIDEGLCDDGQTMRRLSR